MGFQSFVLLRNADRFQQAPFVHLSGTFLPWHRYYIHIYSEGLRDQCNYTGPIPYWDWPLYAPAPRDSPIFKGDDCSLGSNGEYIPNHPGIILPDSPFGIIPPGQGIGCLMRGPFRDFSVNLGPIVVGTPGHMDGLGYNPRQCDGQIGVLLLWEAIVPNDADTLKTRFSGRTLEVSRALYKGLGLVIWVYMEGGAFEQ
ncbi:hypothetical protein HYFRA_00010178 [Hymenoscyphus fraxineus]|uniref:Tyrosinase copper-binding domain-containing protein n=1 Tax=Hymenoscyphus fraxineus TaxID=746836 RepID=A0A9N9KT53_9HELO|nr:hypothetical protein HYFRA_00010178 [Hymenoscyphus fraxineus]